MYVEVEDLEIHGGGGSVNMGASQEQSCRGAHSTNIDWDLLWDRKYRV